MAQVYRIAQIVHLKPSAVAAYKRCHANVWPEVLQQIKDCNIKDCRLHAFLQKLEFYAGLLIYACRLDLL